MFYINFYVICLFLLRCCLVVLNLTWLWLKNNKLIYFSGFKVYYDLFVISNIVILTYAQIILPGLVNNSGVLLIIRLRTLFKKYNCFACEIG